MANTLNTESVKMLGGGPSRAGRRIFTFTYTDDNGRTSGTSTRVELDGTETAEEAKTKAIAAINAVLGN